MIEFSFEALGEQFDDLDFRDLLPFIGDQRRQCGDGP